MGAKIVNIIFIDGKKIKTERMLHDFLKKELNLPEYYGMNLDALWDCITGHIKLPIKIVWKNYEESKKNFKVQFLENLISLFKDAKEELNDDFDYEIKQ